MSNNPRARKSVPEKKKVQDTSSRDLGSGALASASGRIATRADSASLSGRLSGGLPPAEEEEPLTEEEAQERALRQAIARQERIERQEAEDKKRRRRKRIKRAIIGIILFLVAVFAGLLIAFGIFRWQTYDDAADIQGIWQDEATTLPVTITDSEIVLTDEVSYKYILDPAAKTILFKFGNMEGGGRYRFSLDRTELSITDGQFSWWDNFIDDALWTAESLINQVFFANETPLATEDAMTTVFTRE
ncbi:MAG: hypothetical protein HFJ65_04790 [Eggerthellaceae bacterium]|nr:hypothetical protein [Eggerthellaceae bacterium]